MITNNLFETVLIEPSEAGADKLSIISGYATAAMAFHHLDKIKNTRRDIDLELIVGMCPKDGMSLSNHRAFQELSENDFCGSFKCSYVMDKTPVHSKVYIWYKDDQPFSAFIGSANYTQTAFSNNQRESLSECDVEKAFEYFQQLSNDTIYCTHNEADNFVKIYNDKYSRFACMPKIENQAVKCSTDMADYFELDSVTISLLDKDGNLPPRSGLNWGQRLGREPNQAYIRIPSYIYNNRPNFFPQIGNHFTLLTDDNKVLICSRAQAGGKAIHTPHNNSLIGEYFRNRLNVPFGNLVTNDDLLKYGRNDVTFYRIDDETYFLDFSV